VVALTSLNEGTPLTLIEAMANARAVVATSVGGVVDLLGEPDGSAAAAAGGGVEGGDDFSRRGWEVRERGVLVRPRDAEAFRDGLARVAADAGLRRSLGERGRRFVEGRYSVTRLVADVGRLYEELARGARAGTTSAGGGAAETPQELGRAAARLKGE
jgi:glycosyltransferase involved in cell wall biosynthesis